MQILSETEQWLSLWVIELFTQLIHSKVLIQNIQKRSLLRNEPPILCCSETRNNFTVASFGTSCQTSISFVEQKCLNLSAPIASWLVWQHTAQLRSRRPEFDSRLEVRAVASGVKGGDDYRGPRLRGAPLRSQTTGWGQPKKMLRTVDGPLLHVVTKAYHLHLSLANLKIQKSLKHSNTRRGKAQLSTCVPCSVMS